MSQQYPESYVPPPDVPPLYASKDERLWGMLCHLSALIMWVGVPLGNIIGPLIIWLIKKDAMPFVNDQGKESLNFQISVTIYGLIAAVLLIALIGFVLLPAILIFQLVVTIMAAIKANEGVAYRYPLTIRFIN